MEWHQAIAFKKYDDQFEAFRQYFESYTKWFLHKSNFARYIMKLGLYVFLYAGALYYLNDGTIKPPKKATDPLITNSILFIAPLLMLGLIIFTDRDSKIPAKQMYTLHGAVIILLFAPLLFNLAGKPWQTTIGILTLTGFGTSIAAYMINRLEGYTRAWSRNRTALYKITLNHAEKLSGSLTESQAQRRLLLIVDNEVDDRHRDIISDFHFFGERLTSLLKKK